MTTTAPLELNLTVNGRRKRLRVPAHAVLADVLRDTLRLKGCKVACDAAACGACTVLVDGAPVASCSTFAFEAEGASVTTIEGIGGQPGLDVVQQVFVEREAFQCGYCTAGVILTARALLAAHADPDAATVRDWLGGNTCRCTGYAMIVEAVLEAAARLRGAVV